MNLHRWPTLLIGIVATLTLSAAFAQSPPKHLQAVSAAQRSLSAMGGNQSQTYQDSRAEGTLTVYTPEPKAFAIVLKTKGKSMARTELQTDKGMNLTVRNGYEAVIERNGQVQKLLTNNVIGQQMRHIPAFSLLAQYQDANTSVEHLGVQTINGSQADVIAVGVSPASNPAQSAIFRDMSRTTFAIDQASGFVTMMKYTNFAENNPSHKHEVQVFFSDYRSVNGILVPFRQTSYFDGKLSSELILNSIALNVGLRDDEFTLPQ